MGRYKINAKSKSEYLHCLNIIQDLNLTVEKADGDDWNCKLEIIFLTGAIPQILIEKANRK